MTSPEVRSALNAPNMLDMLIKVYKGSVSKAEIEYMITTVLGQKLTSEVLKCADEI